MIKVPLLILTGLLAVSPASRAGEVKTIEPDWTRQSLQKRLAAGETPMFYPKMNPKTGGYLSAAIHIDAPKATVWDLVAHPNRGPEYLSGIRSAKILEAENNSQRVLTECQFTWLPIVWSYEYKTSQVEEQKIRFEYIRGNLRHFEGHWVLLDGDDFGQAGGTIVYYELYLDPGKLVPKALVRHNLSKDVPNVLRQLKAYAQKLQSESSSVATAAVEDQLKASRKGAE